MLISAIVVCFNPDIIKLLKLCDELISQNVKVILIDNTETFESLLTDFANVTLIRLNENKGISKAQNVGIDYASQEGSDVLIFLDQDSVISSGFVNELKGHIDLGIPQVLAPVCLDEKSGIEYPSMIINRWGILKKKYSNSQSLPYFVDVTISSGLIVTKKAIDKVGKMNEDYFIDFVDTDWCLRCRSNSVRIKIIPNLILKHSIGNSMVKFGVLSLFIHSPIRCYYQVRNSFIFLKQHHVPVLLGLMELFSIIIHQFFLLIYVSEKQRHFKYLFFGIWHGIIGIKGNYKDNISV